MGKKKIVLLVLMGAPGVGKTSLSRALTSNELIDGLTFLHFCYDELLQENEKSFKSSRLELTDNLQVLIECIIGKTCSKCPTLLRNLFNIAVESIKPVVMIIDDNMYYRSMRYNIYNIARNNGIGYSQLYLQASLENALKFNNLRQGKERVPESSVINIFSKIEIPDQLNKWEKYSLVVSAHSSWDVFIDKLENILIQALENPERPVPETMPKIKMDASHIHLIDLALRKLISVKIRDSKNLMEATEFRELPRQLCLKKIEFLGKVKSGDIYVPTELESSELDNYIARLFFAQCD